MKKRLGQVDLETGELLSEFVACVVPKRVNGFGKEWLAMSQSAAMLFAQSRKELGEEGFAVLFALFSRLDFENLLIINQAEIARDLKMQRQNVRRSIKKLITIGALIEGPRIGINRSYKLNPNFGWKGSAKNHVQALDKYRTFKLLKNND